MQDLIPRAHKIAAVLVARHETITIAESSTGGLISAALLGIPGASAYFLGGSVVYTLKARRELLGLADDAFKGIRTVTEQAALILGRAARERLSANWSIAEIGVAGPTGSRYGDPPGHSCIAVVGNSIERSLTVETSSADRLSNMNAFAATALDLLADAMK